MTLSFKTSSFTRAREPNFPKYFTQQKKYVYAFVEGISVRWQMEVELGALDSFPTRIKVMPPTQPYIRMCIYNYSVHICVQNYYVCMHTLPHTYMHTHINTYWGKGGAHGIMVIVVENEHSKSSSNPGRECLHFAKR